MNKVLIVEDDPTIARIYQGLLRMEGYEGELAKDGDAAIECLSRFRPNLVLLDLMLPKKNGIQVLKHIRANPAWRDLPVIVFTNAYMGSLMREALHAGATHCVAKAKTSPKHLMQTIRGFLAVVDSAGATASNPTPGSPSSASEPAGTVGAAPRPSEETAASPLQRASQLVGEMRARLLALAKAERHGGQLPHLASLRQLFGVLSTGASDAGYHGIAQISKALEALAKELCVNPAKLDPSFLRAMAQSLDCVDSLVKRATLGDEDALKTSMVLVLDDDESTRGVISSAMERLGLRSIPLDDPVRAAKLLESNPYDLVFLDADTTRLEGLQLCRRLRQSGVNKAAAVIFVTGRTTLESRALSVMSGADDFIRRPLSHAELAVKALLHLLNPRTRPIPQPVDTVRDVSRPDGPLKMATSPRPISAPVCAPSRN